MSRKPEYFAIDPDDYHARYTGWTKDGRQIFLTEPFVPAIGGKEGAEFIALFIFDDEGNLIQDAIASLGSRSSINRAHKDKHMSDLLDGVGELDCKRIHIKPFSIRRDGVTFGFIAEEFEGDWTVELHPGNYMAFHEPWDSGVYDT